MKKSNNKNHKKFFGRPETPASLPWRRETTRHKLNMAENVLVDVIVKVKPQIGYTAETSVLRNAATVFIFRLGRSDDV